MKVIDADFEMTGGGCYTYWGKFDNGTYFCFFEHDVFDIYDEDYGITFTNDFFELTDGDSSEWEQKHRIQDPIYAPFPKEIKEYVRQTIELLKKKYPKSLSLKMFDMED